MRELIYFKKMANQASDPSPSSPGPIDTGDAALEELCSDNGRSDAEVGDDYFWPFEKYLL